MLCSPLRSRIGLVFTALAATFAGCETVRHNPHTQHTTDAQRPAESTSTQANAATTPVAVPGQHATRRDYYVIYHDFKIDVNDPLFTELDALPEQVFSELKLPPSNSVVQVFLFDTQEHYERYMRTHPRYRDLPPRRAYFIADPRPGGIDELKIFTWLGDHLETDLRHELTHALLRGVLKEVPLWLDEGLASYFELPPSQDGVNPQHLDTLRRTPFRPDLARLEGLTQVAQMEKPEYREAWAWVYLMLRTGPAAKKVLHDYLQSLRVNAKPGLLLPKLKEAVPDPDVALVDVLANVELPPRNRSHPITPK